MNLFSENIQFDNLADATRLFNEWRDAFLHLFIQSPVCMSMTTNDPGNRRYVMVNQIFLEKFGFQRTEVIGKTSTEAGILDNDESAKVGQLLRTKGRLSNDYVKCIAKDGTVIHTVSSIEQMTIGGRSYFISFFIDITQIVEQQAIIAQNMQELEVMNKELKDRNDEIEAQKSEIDSINDHLEELVHYRTQQLESRNNRIREYAFSNSHLVRGPLARILGLTNILEKEPELHKNVLPMIQESAIELDGVIKEITVILAEEV